MKDKIVINIGYSNAGTSSLNEALTLLGYSSIHDAWDIYKEDNPIDLQDRLIPFYDNLSNDRNIFYGFISRYNAFTAAPTTDSSILESIIEQYPKAHYICTKRNHRERYKSARVNRYLSTAGRLKSPKIWIKEQEEKQLYIESVLKKNLHLKVLEFNVCDEGHGWKELCGFLDKDVPSVDFPHENKNPFRKYN